ncbi:LysR family transcriptional regulator [Sporomusa aerivorans]|uniref:LysR family transcriptional regulator n=1 Tax=Sporomusa aerivorans TaxID=204936 RepID=UPI00352AD029
MEIRQLKTFITIVKLGSFSQAAQFLGYTQSTLTTHIQLLEKELDTVLFERFSHQLMLTTDGERLYDYAEQIAKLADDAKNQFDNFAVPHGPIVIGMPESLGVYYLTDVLKEYVALYPDVDLKVKFGIASDFRYLLRKNMMDLAFFLEKSIQDTDLKGQLLWPEAVVMVSSPQHRLARQKQVKVKDLQGQAFVFTDSGSNYRMTLEEIMSKAGVQPRTVLEIGQLEILKQFVIGDLGIAILPLIAVQTEIAAGLLSSLPWQGRDLTTNTFLVYHKEKWHSHAIRAFIKLVHERLLR